MKENKYGGRKNDTIVTVEIKSLSSKPLTAKE